MSKQRRRLQRISRRLSTHQLSHLKEKDIPFDSKDIFGKDIEERGNPYFLGYYSPSGIRFALERYGFFKALKKRGFENIHLIMNTQNPYKQRLAIYAEKKDPGHLIGELVVKRKHINIFSPFPHRVHERDFEVISIEWLCMQNPAATFPADRPRLPGQKHPGLGMGGAVMELLVIMCKRLRTAGLLNIPEHFHNSQMYSPQFRFVNPLFEGKRQAIARDLLSTFSLSEVSWAIDLNCVSENGEAFEWVVSEQLIPLDRDLKEYFNHKKYLQTVAEHAGQYHYSLDLNKWREKREQIEDYAAC